MNIFIGGVRKCLPVRASTEIIKREALCTNVRVTDTLPMSNSSCQPGEIPKFQKVLLAVGHSQILIYESQT